MIIINKHLFLEDGGANVLFKVTFEEQAMLLVSFGKCQIFKLKLFL